MRYAYALTTALLLGGTAATLVTNPLGAQVAQNDPQALASAPRAGAPMSFADLAAKLQPAVVNISTTQRVQVSSNPFEGTPFGGLFGGMQGGRPVTRQATSLGSGFIISPDGYIVTNNHVISPDRRGNGTVESITVIMPDRKEYKAKLIGRDPQSDLAVLKIEATNLPFVRFGDSTQTRVGDWVMAIGNPFGLGGTVTAGIVSALHRNTGSGGAYDRYIQTDASINQGNSGGPMFDLAGNVIGINTAIFSPTGGNVGIGFAIPAEQAKPIVDTLVKGGSVERGYLVVEIQQLDDDSAGALGLNKNEGELIARTVPGEAADKAGIRQGDVIVKVNGRTVNPDQTLSFIVANLPVGTRVPIELIRDGKRMTLTATVGKRPSEDQLAGFARGEDDEGFGEDSGPGDAEQATRGALGLAVIPITPVIARQLGVDPAMQGVVVSSVDPSSEAAGKGLRRGDIISAVNSVTRVMVRTPADLDNAIAAARRAGRNSVLLLVTRGNQSSYVGVPIKQ